MPTYCTASDVRTYSNLTALQTDGVDETVAAVKARGAILYGSPSEGDTITVDGHTFTYSTTPGTGIFASITELNTLINNLTNVDASQNGYTITVSAAVAGVAGNSIAMSKTGSALTLSGATLTGGQDEDVTTDDSHLNALIELAEVYIDAYAGYWTKYVNDGSQARKFPRVGDIDSSGATIIPEAVKFATIAQVEFMYVNMPDSEHGIQPDESPTKATIGSRVKELMRGYVCLTGSMLLPRVQPGLLNVKAPVDLSLSGLFE